MIPSLMLPLLAGLGGCKLVANIQEILDFSALESAPVSALWPMDGAMSLPGPVDLVVAIDGDIPDVEVVGEGSPACTVEAPERRMTCHLSDALEGELLVEVGGDTLRYSAETPSPSEAWFLSEIDSLQAGNDDGTGELLEFLLQSLGLVAVTADGEDGPRLLAGGGALTEDGVVAVDEAGLTLALPVDGDPGASFATEPLAVLLPLDADGELALLLIDEFTVELTAGDGGPRFSASGLIASASVNELAERFGAAELASLVTGYNLDTNGDGAADALDFYFEGPAVEVALRRWTLEE